GFAVAPQRAAIMLLVALGVAVGRRTVGSSNGLAAALLAVVAADPFAVLSASFWLSFGAVALLLALASRRDVPLGPTSVLARWRRAALAAVSCDLPGAAALTSLAGHLADL